MIKLDFSSSAAVAHKQLIEYFASNLRGSVKYCVGLLEYEKRMRRKLSTLGDIDLACAYKNTLLLFEMKTNDDVKGAVSGLLNQQDNLEYVLNMLPKKLTVGISKILYFAVIYELYTVYELDQSGNAIPLCSIDEFLDKFPNYERKA